MAVNKPFVKKGNNFNFQHDIDPKQTATQVKLYSGKKNTQWQTISHELPPSEPKPLYSWRNEGSIWLRTEKTLANFQSLFLPHMQHFHVCLHMLMSKKSLYLFCILIRKDDEMRGSSRYLYTAIWYSHLFFHFCTAIIYTKDTNGLIDE